MTRAKKKRWTQFIAVILLFAGVMGVSYAIFKFLMMLSDEMSFGIDGLVGLIILVVVLCLIYKNKSIRRALE